MGDKPLQISVKPTKSLKRTVASLYSSQVFTNGVPSLIYENIRIIGKQGSNVKSHSQYAIAFLLENIWQHPRRPTKSGTVPLFVEQFHNLWNSS